MPWQLLGCCLVWAHRRQANNNPGKPRPPRVRFCRKYLLQRRNILGYCRSRARRCCPKTALPGNPRRVAGGLRQAKKKRGGPQTKPPNVRFAPECPRYLMVPALSGWPPSYLQLGTLPKPHSTSCGPLKQSCRGHRIGVFSQTPSVFISS